MTVTRVEKTTLPSVQGRGTVPPSATTNKTTDGATSAATGATTNAATGATTNAATGATNAAVSAVTTHELMQDGIDQRGHTPRSELGDVRETRPNNALASRLRAEIAATVEARVGDVDHDLDAFLAAGYTTEDVLAFQRVFPFDDDIARRMMGNLARNGRDHLLLAHGIAPRREDVALKNSNE